MRRHERYLGLVAARIISDYIVQTLAKGETLMGDLSNKTIIITGASRGIGRAMAVRFAGDGANIVIAAKSDRPHPKLKGTIYTVAEEVVAVGGKGRDQVRSRADHSIDHF